MRERHQKRCKRYDNPGQAHCLTFSCYQRRPYLSRTRCCQWMLDALDRGRNKQLYDLWAYVIMPEHVHIVLLPAPDIKIRRILITIKSSVSKRALEWLQTEAPASLEKLQTTNSNSDHQFHFWQRGGGYDRNLRTQNDIHQKIRYIHANPVRRGLIAIADDYPWSSSKAWNTGKDDPIPIDRESLLGSKI